MYTYINQQCSFRHLLIGVILVVLSGTVTLTPRHAQAYKSLPLNTANDQTQYAKLPGSSTIIYYFPDHLTSVLGIPSTGTNFVHALNQWNEASWYSLFDIGLGGTTVTQTTNRILAVNFWGTNPPPPSSICGSISATPTTTVARACPGEVSVYLNSNAKWRWTNTGSLHGALVNSGCTTSCTQYVHYLTAVLHELGHIFGLDHPAGGIAVMKPGGSKSILTQDDLAGAAQFYGPNTSWEQNVSYPWFPSGTYTQTMGVGSLIAYQQNMSGATLTPVSQESGVTPYQGSRYVRLTGTGTANYAYAYMHLLPALSDELGSNPRHLTIVNGATLSWYQYNHTQTKMSVDIAFTDGTTLRDSGLVDQNGIRVHPAWRGSYSTGVWYYFTVNLSLLAGKRVKDIMIAYDSGGTGGGPTGTFKAYIDNLQLTY